MPQGPKRPAFVAAVVLAALSLSGCAQNAFVDAIDNGILGDTIVGQVVDGAAAPAEAPVEQVASQVSWGPPVVVPAGLDQGPRAVAETDGPYLLDTGDRLRIFVYGQPNLSRSYTVDHDGRITVPLIGSVSARGHTTRQLEGIIKGALGRDYVRDPQVTVDILQNRPFFILGEVKTAGAYPYVSGMTVLTAVAIAGGFSERASERSFRITRRINGFMEVIEAPADYVLLPGDTVEVHERFL